MSGAKRRQSVDRGHRHRAHRGRVSDVLGVGSSDEEDPFASVAGTDIRCSNSRPRSHIPDFGKRMGDRVKSSVAKSSNVLDDHPAGAKNPNGVEHSPPEPGSLAVEPGPFAGVGQVGAREPAGDDVDRFNGAQSMRVMSPRFGASQCRAWIAAAFGSSSDHQTTRAW